MVAVKRASFVLVLTLAAVVVLAGGCAKNALKQEHDALRAQLAEVETMGGKVCAPHEFASAPTKSGRNGNTRARGRCWTEHGRTWSLPGNSPGIASTRRRRRRP